MLPDNASRIPEVPVRRLRFPIPLSILFFIGLTLAGTYYVRKLLLEQAMRSAMSLDDERTIRSLAASRPSPVNVRDSRGRTPLNWAAGFGSAALVAELLDRGADVNALARGGGPLRVKPLGRGGRVFYNDGHVKWAPRDADCGVAVSPAPFREVEYEIAAEERPGWGATMSPLGVAAWQGRADVARMLLARGARIELGCEHGETPLETAVSSGHLDLAVLLLDAGADVEGKPAGTWGPLLRAVRIHRRDIAEVLLDRGANVNKADGQGYSVLHWAVDGGTKDVLDLILRRGASLTARTKGGWTPLHAAARQGNEDAAERLLSAGADVSLRNPAGKTALMLAEENGHGAVARLLRTHGAKE